RRPLWACFAAAVLLLLCEAAYLRIVNGSSGLLARLARESVWLHKAYAFDTIYLPRNAANEASLWKQLSFDTVADRLVSGWYFMGAGWVVTLVAAVAIFIAAVRLLGRRAAQAAVAFTLGAIALFAALMLHGPFAAQRAVAAAMRFDAQGDASRAIAQYRRAARRDAWFASN